MKNHSRFINHFRGFISIIPFGMLENTIWIDAAARQRMNAIRNFIGDIVLDTQVKSTEINLMRDFWNFREEISC